MSTVVDSSTTTQLLDYLGRARWFAGKGREAEVVGVTPLGWLHAEGSWPAVRLEVAEVSYPGQTSGDSELYQLALSYWPEPQLSLQSAEVGPADDADLGRLFGYDAMRDPAACRLLMDRLRSADDAADSFDATESSVRCHLVDGGPLSADLEPRIHTGQQSNTSVMFGEVAMLKLFRRLEIGHNLDIEVHDALSRAGVADVARLYGWIEGSWTASDGRQLTTDLAMVVEKLTDAEDGWELALATLRDGSDFAPRIVELGRVLAETHDALRREFGTAEVRGQQIAAVMQERLSTAARTASQLQPYESGLRRRFEALTSTTLSTQRVHGDFHLGQTLWTPDGWKIIDFEGEPAKSLAERKERDSVWRDIAGILRSFDYAAASVPGPSSRRWAEDCGNAFLSGYAGGDPSEADQGVLSAYLADKAVYEVVYEVRNRPDWVQIPLRAAGEIAGTAPPSARSNTSVTADQVKE